MGGHKKGEDSSYRISKIVNTFVLQSRSVQYEGATNKQGSMLNNVLGLLACLHAWCACMLACLCSRVLHACMLECLGVCILSMLACFL